MSDFIFEKTELEGVNIISPKIIENERGVFIKEFENNIYCNQNIDFEISEEYKVISDEGVFRGIHFQYPNPQSRLVSVNNGEAVVIAVDLRKESKALGKWIKIVINNLEHKLIYLPKGIGLGTLSRENHTVIDVKCCGEFYSKCSTGIRYDDKTININWEDEKDFINVSDKDKCLKSFDEYLDYLM